MIDGKIYVVRNDVNNKVYVGQTTRKVQERFMEHCCPSMAKKELLAKAIQEIGREHFYFEVLESGLKTQRDMNYREAYHVATLRTVWPDGYNLTTGGTWGKDFKDTKKPFRREFVDAYEAGFTLTEIGDYYGVCNTTVWKHLKKAGVPMRPSGSQPGECNRWPHTKRKPRKIGEPELTS